MRSASLMQYKLLIAIAIGVLTLLASRPAASRLNPARVYCEQLGFEYIRGHTPSGVVGICKLPGDRMVPAWAFLAGEVALEHSYCAQQGLEARHVEDPEVCWSCTACVMPSGELVPAVRAMGMNTAESICGDGRCGTMENIGNCPSDCSSGLYDEFCDGLADGVCDRDCPPEDDPDCASTPAADGGSSGGGGEAPAPSGCGCAATAPASLGLWGLGLAALGLVRRRRIAGW